MRLFPLHNSSVFRVCVVSSLLIMGGSMTFSLPAAASPVTPTAAQRQICRKAGKPSNCMMTSKNTLKKSSSSAAQSSTAPLVDLVVTSKDGPKSMKLGDGEVAPYRFLIKNNSAVPATNVTAKYALPPGMRLMTYETDESCFSAFGSKMNWAPQKGTITCVVPTIAPWDTKEIDLLIQFGGPDSPGNTMEPRLTVTSNEHDKNPANNVSNAVTTKLSQ